MERGAFRRLFRADEGEEVPRSCIGAGRGDTIFAAAAGVRFTERHGAIESGEIALLDKSETLKLNFLLPAGMSLLPVQPPFQDVFVNSQENLSCSGR